MIKYVIRPNTIVFDGPGTTATIFLINENQAESHYKVVKLATRINNKI